MTYTFRNIKFDDFTTAKESSSEVPYSQICEKCAKKYGVPDYILSDGTAQGSICGVERCVNESEYYIDFYPEYNTNKEEVFNEEN